VTRKKALELGELEAELLGSLKSEGRASAGEMTQRIQSRRSIAYTTVSTTLDRLFKKGLVARETVAGKTGPKHVYASAADPAVEKRFVEATVGRLVDAFGPSVTSKIYDTLNEISPEELRDMKEAIEKRRKSI
jgi:predicted transcriptional regulator